MRRWLEGATARARLWCHTGPSPGTAADCGEATAAPRCHCHAADAGECCTEPRGGQRKKDPAPRGDLAVDEDAIQGQPSVEESGAARRRAETLANEWHARLGEASHPGPDDDGDARGDGDDPPVSGRGGDRGIGLPVVTGNTTGWSALYDWMGSCRRYLVVCGQEHKQMHSEDVDAASEKAKARGWKSFWARAIPSVHEAREASGGAVVLVRSDIGAYDPPGGSEVVAGHCAAALVEAGGIGGVVVYSIYLRCGDELSSYNWNILTAVSKHIAAHGRPWAVCGDWNLVPTTLAASGWIGRNHGVAIRPPVTHTTTVNGVPGRLIDFVVVSKSLAKLALSCHIDGTAPIRTHSAVGLSLPAAPRAFVGTVIRAPRRFPLVKPIGPRKAPLDAKELIEAAAAATRAATSGRMDEARNGLNAVAEGWMTLVEEELIREYHIDEDPENVGAYRGRAMRPSFVEQPLLGLHRHGRHADCGGDTRRIRLLQDRAADLAAAINRRYDANGPAEILERARAAIHAGHHVGHAASPASPSKALADELKSVAKKIERGARRRRDQDGEPGDHAADGGYDAVRRLMDTCRRAADAREADDAKEKYRAVADWCRDAEANGAAIAHRWTRVPTGWRPETTELHLDDVVDKTSNPAALVAAESQKWRQLWAPPGQASQMPDWGTPPPPASTFHRRRPCSLKEVSAEHWTECRQGESQGHWGPRRRRYRDPH